MKDQNFFDDIYHRNEEGWGFSYRKSQLYRYDRYQQLMKAMQPASRLIVDIGCGEGFFSARYLKTNTNDVIGIDISPVAVGRAKEKFPDIEFIVGNVSSLPWKTIKSRGDPDLYVLSEIMTYLDPSEQRKTVDDLFEQMKSGSYLLASVNVGPFPYFSQKTFYDLFSKFELLAKESMYTKTYYAWIETPICNGLNRFRKISFLQKIYKSILRHMPIHSINKFGGLFPKQQESIHFALFRKR